MAAKYIRKGRKNNWTDAQLEAAKEKVESGGSVRSVAEKYGIPKSTLHDHIKGVSKKRYGGPSTVLTAEEEKEIAASCLVLQELGFPLTKDHLSIAVRDYLKDRGRSECFRDGIPGYSWWVGFFRRHPRKEARTPTKKQGTSCNT